MIVADRDYVLGKYNLKKLKEIEDLVAGTLLFTELFLYKNLCYHCFSETRLTHCKIDLVEVNIPFDNYITGFCAFTHKAGIHAKAILNNPSTYEILNPADFGMSRYVHFASRLTGWNAIKSRCDQLGLKMTDAQYKACTVKIKALADVRKIAIDDTDSIIRAFHFNLHNEEERTLLEGLTAEEKKKFAEAEAELLGIKEKRALDAAAGAEAEVPTSKKTKTAAVS
jgi:homocitrate synthase